MIIPNEKILLAASGGKDSTAMIHIMTLLKYEVEYDVIGLHINLGIGSYSDKCNEKAIELFEKLNIPYVVIRLDKIIGLGIPKLSKIAKRKACSICGIVKRYLMNYTANYVKADKIATGHTIDDMGQYLLKAFLLQDIRQLNKIRPINEKIECLNLAGRIKPLCEITEKETYLYAYVNKLPFAHEECPLVRRDTLDFQIRSFIKVLEYKNPSILISLIRKHSEISRSQGEYINGISTCSYCKMPSSSEICAFCRLMLRIGKEPESIINSIQDNLEGALFE